MPTTSSESTQRRGPGAARAITPAQPWRYDLGHGYCRYEFFSQCPHRLACARCDYYEPKDSQDVLILEAEGNLVRLRQDLLLTDDEQGAIDGDVMTFQKLRARHWNTPTPSGPSPRELNDLRGIADPKDPAANDAAKREPGPDPYVTGQF
jgi:hypothetical protein